MTKTYNLNVMKIVVDMGGTKIKWAVIDKSYKIIEEGKEDTEAFTLKAQGVIERVGKLCEGLNAKYENVEGVVISMPGVIDSGNTKSLVPLHFIPAMDEIDIAKEFAKHCKLKILIINDANAAALGEYQSGSLKGCENSIMITLGTGIGAGIIIGGKLYLGHNFAAGEVGSQNVNGAKWENIASTRWLMITSSFITGFENASGDEILSQTQHNDELRNEYHTWLNNLAIGIANLILILSPQKISIGGGISENKLFDINLLDKLVKDKISISTGKEAIMTKATLGNKASMIGSAKFFDQYFDK